jgi:hypothetical protein
MTAMVETSTGLGLAMWFAGVCGWVYISNRRYLRRRR